jgi:hypothetical protein
MAAVPSGAPLIQGTALTPDLTIDPQLFYANTRRLRYQMANKTAISGIGSADTVSLRQSGIVAALEVRLSGNVVFGGTIGTTTMSYEWPYNLIKAFTLSANGQSTLINARGLTVRAHEFASNTDLTDRGVARTFGSGSYGAATQGTLSIDADAATQGTLSIDADNWGDLTSSNYMAPGKNVAATGTYPVDLTFFIPVAADQVSLIGSVFAQSAATNLTLGLQYSTQAELLSAVGASATIDWSGLSFDVTGVVYSIPTVNGKAVIPDLTQFHSLTESLAPTPQSGVNEPQLPGVGAGRKLLRVIGNTYSGTSPGTPLEVNDTNYTTVGWSYGGNTVPEQYVAGGKLRALNERQTGTAMGKLWGLWMWDFASQFALRDVVDEGSTANLRVQVGLAATPTAGRMPICQENLFSGVVGA